MTKEDIVFDVLQKTDSFLSEGALVNITGFDIPTVRNAIGALRERGFYISGSASTGYMLEKNIQELSVSLITSYMQNKFNFTLNFIKCFETIDSTNLYAKQLLEKRDFAQDLYKFHKGLIVAANQSAGRGRLGRKFFSPKGHGVYFSMIYIEDTGIKDPAFFTAIAAVSVVRAIKELYNISCQIKWVNDIYLNNRKVCGILTQGVIPVYSNKVQAAIIGIGINITQDDSMPQELAIRATSLLENRNAAPVLRSYLVCHIMAEFFRIFETNSIMQAIYEYKELSLLKGHYVTVNPLALGDNTTLTYKALVLDIDDNLHLVIQKEDGTILHLNSGEVSLHNCI